MSLHVLLRTRLDRHKTHGRALHRLLARMGDGHLAVALPSLQPGAAAAARLLPLLPIRVGDSVYVDASEPAFPPGTRLLAIDGVAIDELYDRLAALVLLDVRLPVVSGFDILTEVRSHPSFRSLPVMMMFSNSEDEHDIAKSYELGANFYQVKPRDGEEYIEFLNSLADA